MALCPLWAAESHPGQSPTPKQVTNLIDTHRLNVQDSFS